MKSQQKVRRLKLKEIDGVTIVEFVDKMILDEANIDIIGEELYSLVDQQGINHLVLNFRNVERISSAALGKLILLYRKVQAAEGKILLCEISDFMVEVFRLVGFKFVIVPDEAAALKAFES